MIVKTSELDDAPLAWAVAKIENLTIHHNALLCGVRQNGFWISGLRDDPNKWVSLSDYSNGTLASTIIARDKISIIFDGASGIIDTELTDVIAISTAGDWAYGSTMEIAAMRCHVLSRIGKEVDIPRELIPGRHTVCVWRPQTSSVKMHIQSSLVVEKEIDSQVQYRGSLDFDGESLCVEFYARQNATTAEKDAAFLAAVAQKANIEYAPVEAVGQNPRMR